MNLIIQDCYTGKSVKYIMNSELQPGLSLFREARNNFRQSDNVREETESTLDMAAAAFHSKDIEKAMRLSPPLLIWPTNKRTITWQKPASRTLPLFM